MTLFLHVASGALSLVAAALFLASARSLRRILIRTRQLERIEAELGRALRQLDSVDPADILVGLHTIAMIRDVEVGVVAIPKLKHLAETGNAQIARQARVTAQRVEERLRFTG